MTKKSSRDAEPADDAFDQVISQLDEEQTREFLEIMDNPPPANDALKALMKRKPPWGERTKSRMSLVCWSGRDSVLSPLEEMNEAVAEHAAEDDGRIKKG